VGAAFLTYFDTGRASNGGTEAINGLVELHRRIARGDNYRLRTPSSAADSITPPEATRAIPPIS
jgi:transposase